MLSLAQQFFRTFDYVHFCDCGPHKGTAPCDNARIKISGHHETPGHVWADAATTHVTMTVDDAGVITVKHENILDGEVVKTVKKRISAYERPTACDFVCIKCNARRFVAATVL